MDMRYEGMKVGGQLKMQRKQLRTAEQRRAMPDLGTSFPFSCRVQQLQLRDKYSMHVFMKSP